ncbi:hypothetical protein D3C75_938170 [compost metagenome]
MLIDSAVQKWLFRHVQVSTMIAVQQRLMFLALLGGDREGVFLLEREPAIRQRVVSALAQAGQLHIAVTITFDRGCWQRVIINRGRVDSLALEVTHETFRVCRAAVALLLGIVLAHGAHAVGLNFFNQIAAGVIAG